MHRPGSEDPHRRERKLIFLLFKTPEGVVVARPANNGGSWKPSSKKESELQENVEENSLSFIDNSCYGVTHLLVFKFWKTFFK